MGCQTTPCHTFLCAAPAPVVGCHARIANRACCLAAADVSSKHRTIILSALLLLLLLLLH
jgi:hypothetical protein